MSSSSPESSGDIDESIYGTLPDGRKVRIWTLRNLLGMEVQVTEYGAILVSVKAPDRDGKLADLTLGYDSLDGWLGNSAYFGASIGRFGNRIAGGNFTLEGREYHLAINNAPGGQACSLHGGKSGFSMKLWQGLAFRREGVRGVRLSYESPDGEEGYPGCLSAEITYALTDENELIWDARATTDQPTVVNLVHHSYWNLSGDPTVGIAGHDLKLDADHFLAINAGLIPTGEKRAVAGTPLDFRTPHRVGERIDEDFEALRFAGGYDQAFLLSGARDQDGLLSAAHLRDPGTGRVMTLATDQPVVQFYSGNFLDGSVMGKGGIRYAHRAGLCLETQTWPDAPNQAGAPSAVLRPGERYHHRMVHRFSIE